MGRLEGRMTALHDSMSMMGDRRINVEVRLNPTIVPGTFHQAFNSTPINQEEGCEEETPKGIEGEEQNPCEGRDVAMPDSLIW
ncbi:hypothetical protein MTR67_051857 [Solanum verrucosum]|uniref:Uncharacterized protein n=1 Tax=Solanum verrucosum TaxID=315347 RepID=A0AAF0ZZG9_SOLVR|nr:hypothetical protein MTR67_051857 [Solanum verrucosum]